MTHEEMEVVEGLVWIAFVFYRIGTCRRVSDRINEHFGIHKRGIY
jgi:hypothetical protein